jgi:hypothetical protein
MIEQKRRYGSLNLGETSYNVLDDPVELLKKLVQTGQVVPGDPEGSPFLAQMKFGGRMYRVFTDDEQQAWADWIRALTVPAGADRLRRSPFAAAAKPVATAEQPPARVHVPHLLYSSSAEEVHKHPRGTLLGHGATH